MQTLIAYRPLAETFPLTRFSFSPGAAFLIFFVVALAAVGPANAQSASGTVSRQDALNFYSQIQIPEIPAGTSLKNLPPAPSSPPEHAPYLEAVRANAVDQADPELTAALLRYQFIFRGTDNTLPATIVGEVFFEQTPTLVEELEKMPALQRVLVFPFIKFGFQKVTQGKLKSGRRYVRAKQALDRLHGRMMNARHYDAARSQ